MNQTVSVTHPGPKNNTFDSTEYFSLHYTSYVTGDSDYFDTTNGATKWKGPRRVCIFCTTAVILPSLLISVPLLMRFVIYGSNSYVLHPSDTRILDQRISTTWCEGASVTVNYTSFTVFVTQGVPDVLQPIHLPPFEKYMSIPDDQKEYWGLYLLPGSVFTVKTCARFKGGTLLIVRGTNHMQYCAYVGENDSAGGDSDQASGSASFEARFPNGPGGDHPQGGQGENILSRLKNFLQSHPGSRNKIQKTLEDWMLLNSSSTNSLEPEATSTQPTTPISSTSGTERVETETSSQATPSSSSEGRTDSIKHGTIRRRRSATDIRPDSESGENAAFEDDSVSNGNNTNSVGPTGDADELLLPHLPSKRNASSVARESIWREQHNQHGGFINSTISSEDGSMSESESSFSSSEEALLKCEGIIASFKIPHEDACVEEGSFETLSLKQQISGMEDNVFRFEVSEGDYYYFIFGSENEKHTNSIRAQFRLEKAEYRLPEPLPNCTDVEECQIPFSFASSEKVVIKLPHPVPEENSSVVYQAETICKPRSHLYLIFVILVPVVILLFAFK